MIKIHINLLYSYLISFLLFTICNINQFDDEELEEEDAAPDPTIAGASMFLSLSPKISLVCARSRDSTTTSSIYKDIAARKSSRGYLVTAAAFNLPGSSDRNALPRQVPVSFRDSG